MLPNQINFPIGAFNNKKSPKKDDLRNTNGTTNIKQSESSQDGQEK